MRSLVPATLVLILSACAPHFYEAKALKLQGENIEVLSIGELSEHCISSSEIPRSYVIHRKEYSIQFAVYALQLGIKLTHPDSDSYRIASPQLKVNDPRVTQIDGEYPFYIPVLEPGSISVAVLKGGKEVRVEALSVTILTCAAVVMDAI